MDELIKVNQNEGGELLVSGRDLHEFLEIGTRYDKWIKRMFEYGFEENIDYLTIVQKRPTAQGNETTYTDHVLKLDTAKEISMIQRNEKGKLARQYFINCEKKLKQLSTPSYMIEDPIARAERWIQEQKERKQIETQKLMLEQQVKEYEPKVTYYDKILHSKGTLNITQIAKDYGLSGKALNKILKEERIQYKQNGQWLLYSDYQSSGYTKSHTQEYIGHNGETQSKLHTRWTQKGRLFIHNLLEEQGIKAVMDKEPLKNID